MSSTRRERLERALEAWEAGTFNAVDPAIDQWNWITAAIASSALADGNVRSYSNVLKTMITREQAQTDEPPAFPNTVRKYSRRYALSEGDDGDRHYIFYSKAPFSIPELVIEEMKRSYSNKPLGLGWTINQVCKHFCVGRKEFLFVKHQLGWSKDQDEFTGEEHLELSTHQMLEDREQRSRWLLDQEARRAEDADIARRARLWDGIVAHMDGLEIGSHKARDLRRGREDMLAVFPMTDFHFEEEAGARAKVDHAVSLMKEVHVTGMRLLLAWMGDWFHYDTFQKGTTRGTAVGAEAPRRMVNNAYSAANAIIEAAIDIFGLENIDTLVVCGNHDRMATFHLAQWLETRMGRFPDFQEGPKSMELAAYRFGNNMLMFEHGDGANGKMDRIIIKAAALYGVEPGVKRVLYTGHLHHAKMVDVGGVLCLQLMAPKAKDTKHDPEDWESKGCYESMPGMRIDVYNNEHLLNMHWSFQ